LARPEPFRLLLEQALEAEGHKSVQPKDRVGNTAENAADLARKLDQVMLAGVTPPRGNTSPRARAIPQPDAPPSASSSNMAAADKTIVSPRAPVSNGSVPAPVPLPPSHLLMDTVPNRELTGRAAQFRYERPRVVPPPLPPRRMKPKYALVPLTLVPRAWSQPEPRMLQVLAADQKDATAENTDPSLTGSSSGFMFRFSGPPSSTRGVGAREAGQRDIELNRPAPPRPLPPLASLVPMPAESVLDEALERVQRITREAPVVSDGIDFSSEDTDSFRLEDIESIQDLDSLAKSLGLKGVADASVPSGDGVVVSGEGAAVIDAPSDRLTIRELGPEEMNAIRSAAVFRSLGKTEADGGKEDVFASSSDWMRRPRPALPAKNAAVPVIVKIPPRPKVSQKAREQARRLYLTAVEMLGQGDRVGALSKLNLAITYDDGVPLYQELRAQLTHRSLERRV